MKVAIVNVQAPFVWGGAEYLADSLAGRVRMRGHRVEVVKIPFKWYPTQTIAEHMLACRLLSVGAGEPDLVVALKFPAYLAPCANKKVWLLHQFRQVYEQWDTPLGMPATPENCGLREMIHQADNACLGQVKGLYTNSRIVAGRLKRFNDIDVAGVLYPPLDRPELFRCGKCDSYFFYPSRQNQIKRQHLAVEAMRHVRGNFRLVLAGKPDAEDYGRQLNHLIERWHLQDKVVQLGFISEEDKARYMADACAALYLPFDEDSYGYVTLEAFHSHKPVLTFNDSGGTNELIEDGLNGLILEPTPEALAAGMDALWSDKERARDMGEAAHQTLARHRIDWGYILDTLLQSAA
jgi:glycosyltransferase involved in cell wall biosynthesis